MTTSTLERRSAAAAAPTPASRGAGEWRVATRLARREVRRRWGRTLLVMILVAVPVFGMTVVTVLVRTTRNTSAHDFANQFGAADLAAIGDAPTPAGGWPAGTRVVRGREVDTVGVVATDGAARLVTITDIDLTSPVTKGAVLLRAGRFPTRPGEALLSPKLASTFHVGVGDRLRLAEPAWTERVVGIGVRATNWNDGFLAVRGRELAGTTLTFTIDPVQDITLVRLPGHPSTAELRSYAPAYESAETYDAGGAGQAVNWTLVAGMVALAIAGVVISGAFAVGARRQLVTLGQLSSNGADERLLRRMLSLQGAWSGVLGSAVGIAAGVITLVMMHARFNGWIHRDIGSFIWSGRDLTAIAVTGVLAATIAAFVPARTAARVPVLSALAGRRPLGRLPRSVVPIGAALFAFGVVVLALVAAASRNGGGNGLAFAAVLGGLLVLAGACCVSPVVVASLAGLGRAVRGAGRVAVRSIVRSRARSAAVVMALAAINAGAIAIGTAFASSTVESVPSAVFMPDNALVVVRRASATPDGATPFLPVPPSVERTLRTILPKATWTQRRGVLGSSINGQSGIFGEQANGKRIVALGETDVMIVADPAVLHLVGLSAADARTLQRVGVLTLRSLDVGQGASTTVRVQIQQGATVHTVVAARAKHPVRATGGVSILITPAKAHALGLAIVNAGVIITNPSPLDESQRASIDAVTPTLMFGPSAAVKAQANCDASGKCTREVPVAPDSPGVVTTDILWSGPRSTGISADVVRQIILAVVVLIALIVLAMSLALSAAETRDERDVLVALGARPSTMRAVSAWKAGLLSFTGAALAVPTGFIPVAVAFLAAVRTGERAQLTFPWSTAAELLLAAPILAAVIAAVGSAVAQRVRPTQMSTFATD